MNKAERPHILNVDDNDAGRYAVTRTLRQAGFEVSEAVNGTEALHKVMEKPDLVILDVNLPDLSGFEVCRRIKADPETDFIPVIHLSATSIQTDSKVEGLEGGADGYLVQPVEPRELLATVKAFLRLKEAERSAAEAAQYWQTTFDAMRDGICLLDPEGRVLRCNRAFAAMTGREGQEIVGLSCCEVLRCTTEFIENCPMVRAKSSLKRETLVEKLGERWLQVSVDPVLNKLGKVSCLVHIICDITEQKRAEDNIQHLNRLLRAIRDVNQLIVRERNPKRLIDAACRLLVEGRGYSGAMIILTDPVGRPTDFAEAGVGEAFEPVAEQLRAGILPGCCQAVRARSEPLLVSDRTSVCRHCPLCRDCPACDTLCARMHLDGRTYGFMSVAVAAGLGGDPEEESLFAEVAGDIAYALHVIELEKEAVHAEQERRLAEAQLRQAQKMEALGTLAGGIAHDFNNILGIIVGYTEMARWDSPVEGRLHRQLQEVLKAANRAGELVKQILAFSRQTEQQKQPVQMGFLVKEALRMLRASIPTTIEIHSEVASRSTVLADPTQIHQVLMNLCTNAAYAMREQGGVLQVGLKDRELGKDAVPPFGSLEPGLYVELSVKDSGHGIEPAILDRIFDPFFTTKELGEGTGLGLSVVHGIVRNHGGCIEVASRPGEGALFRVLFPAVAIQPANAPEEPLPVPKGSERILFVDDEPLLAQAGKHILEQLGYRVVFRTNSLEALETFRSLYDKEPFELLITDMTMPHLTGVELARELRHLQPDLPVIICTGFSERIDADRARTIGLDGFLMKPVVLKELAALVRKVLDRKGGRKAE